MRCELDFCVMLHSQGWVAASHAQVSCPPSQPPQWYEAVWVRAQGFVKQTHKPGQGSFAAWVPWVPVRAA